MVGSVSSTTRLPPLLLLSIVALGPGKCVGYKCVPYIAVRVGLFNTTSAPARFDQFKLQLSCRLIAVATTTRLEGPTRCCYLRLKTSRESCRRRNQFFFSSEQEPWPRRCLCASNLLSLVDKALETPLLAFGSRRRRLHLGLTVHMPPDCVFAILQSSHMVGAQHTSNSSAAATAAVVVALGQPVQIRLWHRRRQISLAFAANKKNLRRTNSCLMSALPFTLHVFHTQEPAVSLTVESLTPTLSLAMPASRLYNHFEAGRFNWRRLRGRSGWHEPDAAGCIGHSSDGCIMAQSSPIVHRQRHAF